MSGQPRNSDGVRVDADGSATGGGPVVRRRFGWLASLLAGSGLASLVAVALIGPVDAVRGQEPPAAAEESEPAVAEDCSPESEPGEVSPDDGGVQPGPGCTAIDGEEGAEPGSDPVAPPDDDVETGTGSGTPPGGGETGDRGSGGRDASDRDRDRSARRKRKGHRRSSSGGVAAPGSPDRDPRAEGARGPDAPEPDPIVAPPVAAPVGVPSLGTDQAAIPAFLIPIYRECGTRYGVPWQVLAAINQVETGFGANLGVSSAGAVGWMQFLPSSWEAYGVDANGDGRRDPYEPADAICAAARYLQAAGAEDDLPAAIYAYNHAQWYVDLVIGLARRYEQAYVVQPVPRAKRLSPAFARDLARTADEQGVDWELILAVLRARGERGRTPGDPADLVAIARRIADADRGAANSHRMLARSLFGSRRRALRVDAIARYNDAVGLRGLVKGLDSVQAALERRVLRRKRLSIYPGGRDDIAAGKVGGQVLVLLLYLAERYEEVRVTSLISGHGFYARPGVPSAHAYGRAVDIAAVGGTPVLGNQQPGGVVERMLLDILMLPAEVRPVQVISLLDLGGPSFAAADHHDHVHVGY